MVARRPLIPKNVRKWVLIAVGVILVLILVIIIAVAAASTPAGTTTTSTAPNVVPPGPGDDPSADDDGNTQTPWTEGVWTLVHSNGQTLQYDATTLTPVLVDTTAVPTEAQKFRFLASTNGGDNSFQIAPYSASTVVMVLNETYIVGFYPNTNTTGYWTLADVQGADGNLYRTLLSSFGSGRYLAAISSASGSYVVSLGSNGFAYNASGPESIQWTINPV